MNNTDYELLCQYLDNELDAASREQLEARLAAESDLRDLLVRFRTVDARLHRAMGRDNDVPVAVAALLAKPRNGFAVFDPRQPWGLAVAASLLVGVLGFAGKGWLENRADHLLVPDLEESAAFVNILEKQPSRANGWLPVEDDVHMRPVLSFVTTQGTWCREFLASHSLPDGQESWRGVACRRNGQWDMELLVQTPGIAAENQGYHTASAATADLVASFVDTHSAAIPLGPEEEAALIENQWHRPEPRPAD